MRNFPAANRSCTLFWPPRGVVAALLLLLAGWALTPAPATAGSWLFERSFYSHSPAEPVRIGPHTSGGPYYSRPTGAYVRGAWRRVQSTIVVGGFSQEQANYWESWIQQGTQY